MGFQDGVCRGSRVQVVIEAALGSTRSANKDPVSTEGVALPDIGAWTLLRIGFEEC
jgi:hypothetical protein